MKNIAAFKDKEFRGFMIGWDLGASLSVFGSNVGRELIVVRSGADSLQIGVVTYNGVSGGASIIPAGVSPQAGILHGDCKNIDDYLGYFGTVDVAGVEWNSGLAPDSSAGVRQTGCDSTSVLIGMTTPIALAGVSLYRKNSQVVEVRGPRIKKLLEMMDKIEVDAARRRWAPVLGAKNAAESTFRPEEYEKTNCNNNLHSEFAKYLIRARAP